ncbi:MAG TPA: hypothetical protein VFX39_06630, partial [Gemmatimonadaceae bacterium]|nr:hypothetical protein [Gemmatimonadaceae bacterium]
MTTTPDPVTLRGGDASVTLAPALGGKITSLHLGGREWLWTSDVIPYRVPDEATRADDASYVRTADTGGYDECFPTVGPCTIPRGVPTFGGVRLPDHGELWSQQPAQRVEQDDDGERATTTWTGRRMPYDFTREVRLGGDGRVTMRYEATNHGDAAMPFLWSAHPLLPLGEGTRLHLPHGARLRADATHGFRAGDGEMRWPMLVMDGATVDVSRPDAIGEGRACKLFLDLPPGPVRCAIEEDGVRLEVAIDGAQVTHFGVWINDRGWTPFEGGRPYRNLAFEPCIGAPDSLADALERWHSAAWLAPGETRRWELVWGAVGA